jgi:hypothetical protein
MINKLFKGFIQAQKDFWRDLKAVWKPALLMDVLVGTISWITGYPFETVLLWTMGFILCAMLVLTLYTVAIHLWRKRRD